MSLNRINKSSINTPFKESVAAGAWKDAITLLKKAKDSGNELVELRSKVDGNEKFLDIVDGLLEEDNAEILAKCKPIFRRAVERCLEKLEKEHKLLLKLNGKLKTLI